MILSLCKSLEMSSHGMWLAGSPIQEQATRCWCRVHCYHMSSLESDDELVMVKRIDGKQKKKYNLIFTILYRSQEIIGVRVLPQERFDYDIRKRSQLNRLKAT